jgi:hypothetical protein
VVAAGGVQVGVLRVPVGVLRRVVDRVRGGQAEGLLLAPDHLGLAAVQQAVPTEVCEVAVGVPIAWARPGGSLALRGVRRSGQPQR